MPNRLNPGCNCCGCDELKYPFVWPDIITPTIHTIHRRVIMDTERTVIRDVTETRTNGNVVVTSNLVSDNTVNDDSDVTVINSVAKSGRAVESTTGGPVTTTTNDTYDPPEMADEDARNDNPNTDYVRTYTLTTVSSTHDQEDFYRMTATFDVAGFGLNDDLAADGDPYLHAARLGLVAYFVDQVENEGFDVFTDRYLGVEIDTADPLPTTAAEFDERYDDLVPLSVALGDVDGAYDLDYLSASAPSTLTFMAYQSESGNAKLTTYSRQRLLISQPFNVDRFDSNGSAPGDSNVTISQGIKNIETDQLAVDSRRDWRAYFDFTEDETTGERVWKTKKKTKVNDREWRMDYWVDETPSPGLGVEHQYEFALVDELDAEILKFTGDIAFNDDGFLDLSLHVEGMGIDRTFVTPISLNAMRGLILTIQDETLIVSVQDGVESWESEDWLEEGRIVLVRDLVAFGHEDARLRGRFTTSDDEVYLSHIKFLETAPITDPSQSDYGYGYYYEAVEEESDCPDPIRGCVVLESEESLRLKVEASLGGTTDQAYFTPNLCETNTVDLGTKPQQIYLHAFIVFGDPNSADFSLLDPNFPEIDPQLYAVENQISASIIRNIDTGNIELIVDGVFSFQSASDPNDPFSSAFVSDGNPSNYDYFDHEVSGDGTSGIFEVRWTRDLGPVLRRLSDMPTQVFGMYDTDMEIVNTSPSLPSPLTFPYFRHGITNPSISGPTQSGGNNFWHMDWDRESVDLGGIVITISPQDGQV